MLNSLLTFSVFFSLTFHSLQIVGATNPETSDLLDFLQQPKDQKTKKLFQEAKTLKKVVSRESKEKLHIYSKPNLYIPFVQQFFFTSSGAVTNLQGHIQELYQDSSLYVEKYLSPNPIQKLSGNPLYIVKKQGEIFAFIKGFLFLDEYVRVIIGDHFLHNLSKKFRYLLAPETHDYFIYDDGKGSIWPMLVMKKSTGTTLDSFIPNWSDFFEALKKSVRAIHELHQHTISFPLNSIKIKNFNMSQQMESQLNFIIEKLPLEVTIDTKKLLEVSLFLKDSFLNFPGPFTYHHGDFLLGNVLIHNDQVTLIDNHSLVYSLNDDYTPVGRPEIDYAKMYNKLILMADIYQLNEETRKDIINRYDSFFQDKTIYKMDLDQNLKNFFLLTFALDDIFRILKDKDGPHLREVEERKLKGQIQHILLPILSQY